MTELEDVLSHLQRFSWPDYLVFVLMLIMCICIGIYFGFKQKSGSEVEYLMGGRSMMMFPIALSLIASFISGITLLGLPTEIYSFGIQYLYIIGGVVLMGFVMAYLYLPVFHDLNITSTYEYLESRFDRRLRMFGSTMFMVMNVGYLPIVVYVPALAFNQVLMEVGQTGQLKEFITFNIKLFGFKFTVTGVNIHIITPIVCVVCVFYTCVGGLKAVVWTDVVQSFSMFGALFLVAVKGTIDLGGSNIVFNNAWNSNRIELPNFEFNPTIRHTFWSQIIGGFFYWLQANAVSQNMIQRYLALPTLRAGRQAVWFFIGGVCTLMLLCSYNGLLIYATYRKCDPLTTKLAPARDQLLPLFVMDVLGELPGLSGLFIAGVFSAALSSLSTCLNSMAAVVLEDFFKPFARKPLSRRFKNWTIRLVVVIVGALCVTLVVVVQKMGTVLQLTMSLEAITNGPLLGIFTMGILLPWINGNSALLGGVVGVIAMSWVSLNAQWAIASGAIEFQKKPVSIEECPYNFNISEVVSLGSETTSNFNTFPLYRMSYMWYTFFGAFVTVSVAILSIAVFGINDSSKIHPSLITPCLRKYICKEKLPGNQEKDLPNSQLEIIKIERKESDLQ